MPSNKSVRRLPYAPPRLLGIQGKSSDDGLQTINEATEKATEANPDDLDKISVGIFGIIS